MSSSGRRSSAALRRPRTPPRCGRPGVQPSRMGLQGRPCSVLTVGVPNPATPHLQRPACPSAPYPHKRAGRQRGLRPLPWPRWHRLRGHRPACEQPPAQQELPRRPACRRHRLLRGSCQLRQPASRVVSTLRLSLCPSLTAHRARCQGIKLLGGRSSARAWCCEHQFCIYTK